MPELKTPAISERAQRALARAAHDRHAQLVAGLVAGTGAAIVATKAALDRRDDGVEPAEDRTYRLRRKEPAAAGIRRIAEGRADVPWSSFARARTATRRRRSMRLERT
jgi:hypothetical protein